LAPTLRSVLTRASPSSPRHHSVDDRGVVGAGSGQHKPVATVGTVVDLVPSLAQPLCDIRRGGLVVLDEQNLHG